MATPDYKTYHPVSRRAWREWLHKNHADCPGIWMVYFKTISGKRALTYAQSVEEALCYGWIDSLPRKLDDQKAMLRFTPRKPGSGWSELNKERIKKLIKNKLMKEAGLAKIKQAKKDGSWTILNTANYQADNNKIPEDLSKAIRKKKKALANFNNFPLGYRRRFLFWIDSAKRPETREARINQTVLMAAANRKPGIKGFK